MYQIERLSEYVPELLREVPFPFHRPPRPAEPTARPYTVKHLRQWLETKNRTDTYDWPCGQTCLLAQYARHAEGHPLADYCTAERCFMYRDPKTWQAVYDAIRYGDWTFGGALARVRELEATWQS